MPAKADLTGQTFHDLTALREGDRAPDGRIRWVCRCVCGAEVQMSVNQLRFGRAKSCGCKKGFWWVVARKSHGLTVGDRNAKEYFRWNNMMARCYSPTSNGYHNYGGRGIKVCDRWRFGDGERTGVECYLADIGKPPFEGATIDRIDNDGNYEPGNVRWATRKQQSRNRRNLKPIEWNGKAVFAVDIADQFGLSPSSIRKRAELKQDFQRRGKPIMQTHEVAERNARLIEIYRNCRSATKAAKAVGLSKSQVCRILQQIAPEIMEQRGRSAPSRAANRSEATA